MKVLITVLLLVCTLFAKEYSKNDRVYDMQTMAEAMTTIETGFFYNNKDLVKSGAAKLSETIKRIKLPKEEKYSEDKVKLAKKSIKVIERKANIIMDSFEKGNVLKAVIAHSKITNRCMECHTHIRKR